MDVSLFSSVDRPIISDGGLGTELERQGYDLSDALWSARLLAQSPEAITTAHTAFYRAGAAIATTASYQASFDGFAAAGIERPEAVGLLRRSVELADAARASVAGDGRPRWVAASVGPFGAALADGSEFRGRYGRTVAELAEWHRPRLEVFADAGADLLALETVPDSDEAEALVEAIAGLDVTAWLTYMIDGDRTRAGQPLAEAFEVVKDSPEIVAVGVNCCAPGDVSPAIATARTITDKPIVVYPNSGEGWDGAGWTGASRFGAEYAARWASEGASVIGGCCRVSPSEIAAVAAAYAR